MDANILSLAPPCAVLVLGYLTHRVALSLFTGIVLAALITSQLAIPESLTLIGTCLWNNLELGKLSTIGQFTELWNSLICLFLLMLGIFVVLLQHSGSAYAYGRFIKKNINSAEKAEKSCLFLSTCLFIDDYFSSLTVGSVMYPLTDAQKIPRAKLAFLVDSMAAPLAILCPFSSWVAAILGFLRENGISHEPISTTLILATPFETYLGILPFMVYSFTLIVSIWFIVKFRITFGLMAKHERIAAHTGNLLGRKQAAPVSPVEDNIPAHANTHISDFLIPVGILLLSVVLGMLYSGHWSGFGGYRPLFQALQYSSAALGLFLGGTAALILCSAFFLYKKRLNLQQLPGIYWEGIQLMLPAIIILLLAWSLGDLLLTELQTGEYLANIMLNLVSINFLPVLLFFTATLIAFTLGSSWGTAAMLFPIVIPLTLSMSQSPDMPTLAQIPMLFLVLGAVLSGCVAGDHISPISDTTVMSATSSRTPHMDHVKTQIPYGMVLIASTGIGFFSTNWLLEYGLLTTCLGSIAISTCCALFLLWLLHTQHAKKKLHVGVKT